MSDDNQVQTTSPTITPSAQAVNDIAALRDLGALFTHVSGPRGDSVEWSALGDVDLVARDKHGRLFLYTVTHEGLVFVAG